MNTDKMSARVADLLDKLNDFYVYIALRTERSHKMNTATHTAQEFYARHGNIITTTAGIVHMPQTTRISKNTCSYCGLQDDCYTAYDPAEGIEWAVCDDCLPAEPYILL